MCRETTINRFTDIQDIGKTTAIRLYDNGYTSYVDIAQSNPSELKRECNLTLTNATLAISSICNELSGRCSNCEAEDCFKLANQAIGVPVDTNSQVICTDCGVHGSIDNIIDSL